MTEYHTVLKPKTIQKKISINDQPGKRFTDFEINSYQINMLLKSKF